MTTLLCRGGNHFKPSMPSTIMRKPRQRVQVHQCCPVQSKVELRIIIWRRSFKRTLQQGHDKATSAFLRSSSLAIVGAGKAHVMTVAGRVSSSESGIQISMSIAALREAATLIDMCSAEGALRRRKGWACPDNDVQRWCGVRRHNGAASAWLHCQGSII